MRLFEIIWFLFQMNQSSTSCLIRMMVPSTLRLSVLCQQTIPGCFALSPMTGMITCTAVQLREHFSSDYLNSFYFVSQLQWKWLILGWGPKCISNRFWCFLQQDDQELSEQRRVKRRPIQVLSDKPSWLLVQNPLHDHPTYTSALYW